MGFKKNGKYIPTENGKYIPTVPRIKNKVKKDGNCPYCWYGDLHNGKCSNCHKGNLKPRTREQIYKGMR